jgi:MYXO-CTERM domain-containing protein
MFKSTTVGVSIAAYGVLSVAGLLGAGAQAQTVLYSTNFNTPTYAAGGLIGQDGWLGTGTSIVNPISVNAAGAVAMTTTGQDVNRPFTTPGLAPSGNSFFVIADITVSAAQATGDYFMHLGDGGTSNFFARIYARSSGTSGFQMALGTSSGTTGLVYGSTVLNFGETYRLVARLDLISGLANDTGALFINPVNPFGIGDTAYVAATTIGVDPTVTISSINLRQGTSTSAPTLVVDNLSVAFVPTPGAAALLGLGALAAGRRRR